MDLLAQKQWLETNLDPRYKQADLEFLQTKETNKRTIRRIATGNHERLLWHLIHSGIATPEDILANRADWDKKHPADKKHADAGADLKSVPNESLKQKATKAIDDAKKKAAKLFNKKPQQSGKQKNRNTQK